MQLDKPDPIRFYFVLTLIDWLISNAFKLLALVFYKSAWASLNLTLSDYVKIWGKAEYATAERSIHLILVLGEDHRFHSHFGIDTRAIARVILQGIVRGKLQGGSTVTQQLVRVVTRRYERTIQRKLRELALASLVDANYNKEFQLSCYLHLAYFGWQMNGLNQACHRLKIKLPCSIGEASQIVARLKYPEPKVASAALMALINRRVDYLCALARSQELNEGRE
jgi:membrane carboxypeptidase/penicillin-binding protein PbpC